MPITVSLTIDGKQVTALEGEKLLWVALRNGIYIPNLCALEDMLEPYAGCRLCFVEIEGCDRPVTSCTEPVREGLVVDTRGDKARRLARTALELLLANHPVDCGHCARNRTCELQKIAAHLKVKLRSSRLRRFERQLPIDDSSPVFTYDPNKCVLCGRCVWVCRDRLGIGALGFAERGFQRLVTTFGKDPIAQTRCRGCAACVDVCPVGSLTMKPGGLRPGPGTQSELEGTTSGSSAAPR